MLLPRDASRKGLDDEPSDGRYRRRLPSHANSQSTYGETDMADRRIKITAGDVSMFAELNDTPTAILVWDSLPIEASGSTWGDEIYFRTPISAEEEDAREVVDMGDVAYWPPGQALCLFFGPTPASQGDEIRPASAVNVLGRIEGDATVLKQVRSGSKVRVERA